MAILPHPIIAPRLHPPPPASTASHHDPPPPFTEFPELTQIETSSSVRSRLSRISSIVSNHTGNTTRGDEQDGTALHQPTSRTGGVSLPLDVPPTKPSFTVAGKELTSPFVSVATVKAHLRLLASFLQLKRDLYAYRQPELVDAGLSDEDRWIVFLVKAHHRFEVWANARMCEPEHCKGAKSLFENPPDRQKWSPMTLRFFRYDLLYGTWLGPSCTCFPASNHRRPTCHRFPLHLVRISCPSPSSFRGQREWTEVHACDMSRPFNG